ncbi:PhoH-like phosphate starvation-inducible [Pseudomonas phage vB_PaeS_PAO1_Ab19]|uniref:PhoH-like phosphate starvation-inducible n=1 Tax=Pseudomonas phage vB_PaeS_PAO1_Ab19 TaxID=1548912 RepID=UPI0018B015B9|nr:PhoH-like phosphate starvation-inducible [Pseudomonas phage vB_PaeS_PAO1_Ab19]
MSKARQNRYPKDPLDEGQPLKVKRLVKPRTEGQAHYQKALDEYELTVSLGPAGTGKTFLAIHHGLRLLEAKEIQRLVITRPAVEAEEKLGYLPGGIEEKMAPYLIPMLDAVIDLVGPTMAKRLQETRQLEIAPLAYMRGRTFNDTFLIADEMQNSTPRQAALLVTRLGFGTRAVLNGDPAQCDLPAGKGNGIGWLADRLRGRLEEVGVVELRAGDVVRSPLVKKLVPLVGDPS